MSHKQQRNGKEASCLRMLAALADIEAQAVQNHPYRPGCLALEGSPVRFLLLPLQKYNLYNIAPRPWEVEGAGLA